MASIIRGTTPTIKYTFAEVTVSELSAVYLTFRQNGRNVIEKDLSSGVVGDVDISWTLTQAETLTLTAGNVSVMINWKLNDGTRGASAKSALVIEENHIPEVI